MRLVLDTNIVISGLLWHGTPATLLDLACDKEIELVTSPALIAELFSILSRTKFYAAISSSGLSPEQLALNYAAMCTVITPVAVLPVVQQDPDDDHVLACALAANVDVIASGDRHLLALKEYSGIPILTAVECLRHLAL